MQRRANHSVNRQISKNNGNGTCESKRNSKSPSVSSILVYVLSVVAFGALPSHGFSSVSPLAASSSGSLHDSILSEEDCVRNQLGYMPPNYVGISAWKTKSENSNHRGGVRIANSDTNSTTNDEQPIMIPVAIQTYPLNGGAKRRQNKAKLSDDASDEKEQTQSRTQKKKSIVQSPFPTLFWLTCPDISKAVANLERRGFVQIFEDELNADPELSQRLFSCHQEYADLRWRSLTEEDRNILKGSSSTDGALSPSLQRMRNMMECSGISGTNFTDISSWDSDYGERAVSAIATNGTKENEASVENESLQSTAVPKVPPIKCLHAHYAHYRSTVLAESTKCINPVGELIHKQLQLDFPDLDL